MKKIFSFLFLAFSAFYLSSQVNYSVDLNQTGVKMSQDLIGAFFEDINYGADGGLYAELVQNRSFEYYNVTQNMNMDPLKSWSLLQEGGAVAAMSVATTTPINVNNPHYLRLNISNEGANAGVVNNGFNGITVKANNKYNFSVYIKRSSNFDKPVIVMLKTSAGAVIAKDTIKSTSNKWEKYKLVLTSNSNTSNALLTVVPKGTGEVLIDMVSLFPQRTFKNRENGLREDLAQAIADLNPRFLRFPGGCISHGSSLENAYRWKHTVGDVAERKPNWNLWGYHQTYGLGFFEFFQYCEDIGAKPLPVLPVGVSCQFRNRQVAPLSEMKPWIDDALDLVEFANGATNTTWGGLRAQMGHPEPFNMEYLCLGNEEDDIPEFRVRFKMIADSVKKYHPEIKIIGTSGTTHSGNMYNTLWQFSRDNKLAAVDEHYYVDPEWLLENIHRYDNFDRSGPKVFIGEYASRNDLHFNAIAEAAYLTGVERNADIIELTCYAPLLCNELNNQWNPDLIRFNNNQLVKTASYYVQQMYGQNAGDYYLPGQLSYDSNYTNNSRVFTGKVGVGAWHTNAQFDDLKITSGSKVLFEDNFTSGSANWQVSSGTFVATGGVYSQTSLAEPSLSIYNNVVDSVNYTYTIRAKKTGGNEGFLIPFGYKDANNYYWFNIAGWSNSQHAIEKVTNGSKSVMMTAPGSINNNQWYELKIVANQESSKCYLDNKLIFEVFTSPGPVSASVTEDKETNEIILKVVNSGETAINSTFTFKGLTGSKEAKATKIQGAKSAKNSIASPDVIKPFTSTITVNSTFQLSLPAYSFQVIRFSKGSTSAIGNVELKPESGLKVVNNKNNNTVEVYLNENQKDSFTFSLFDLQGKLLISQENLSGKKISFNRNNLQAATYLIKVDCKERSFCDKVMLD